MRTPNPNPTPRTLLDELTSFIEANASRNTTDHIELDAYLVLQYLFTLFKPSVIPFQKRNSQINSLGNAIKRNSILKTTCHWLQTKIIPMNDLILFSVTKRKEKIATANKVQGALCFGLFPNQFDLHDISEPAPICHRLKRKLNGIDKNLKLYTKLRQTIQQGEKVMDALDKETYTTQRQYSNYDAYSRLPHR